MSIEAAGSKHTTLFGSLTDRIRGVLARWNEMQRLDSREIEAIARELNLSRTEFAALTFRRPDSLRSLSRRLSHAGLSEDVLAASHSDVLRDLRRVCSQCSSTARCARDLNRERRASPAKYCPNEQTLRALATVADQCTSQVLPFPASRI